MTYEQIVRAWNAQADEHNQYDTLSDRERIEFALRMATQHEFPIAKIVCGTGGGCSLEFTNGADSLDYAGCDVYLRPPIESQDQVEWMQNIDAAMKEPLFNELRALMGTENHGQDIALLQTIRRYRRKTLQAQVRCDQEPAVFPDLPSGVVKHVELGDLFDRMQMHQYAMKYAMASNASQANPVEMQEPVACLLSNRIEFRAGMTDTLFKQSLSTDGLNVFAAPQTCPSYAVNEAIGAGNTELIEILQAECASKQAKIDALMLEYCPNEMTAEQLVEWGEHQAPTECPECEKLKDDVAELEGCRELNRCAIKNLKAERDELAAQVMHWKANHASVVEQARILKERPDMPIERVKAYDNWVATAAQVEKMRVAIEGMLSAPNDDSVASTAKRILAFSAWSKALALPDLSTGILNRVRAEALRKAQHTLWVLPRNKSEEDAIYRAREALRALAADMEAGKC